VRWGDRTLANTSDEEMVQVRRNGFTPADSSLTKDQGLNIPRNMRLIGIATTAIGLGLLSAAVVFIMIGLYSTSRLHTIEATHKGEIRPPLDVGVDGTEIYKSSAANNQGDPVSGDPDQITQRAQKDTTEEKTAKDILVPSENNIWVSDIPSTSDLLSFLLVDTQSSYPSNISPLIDGYSAVDISVSASPKYWGTASWSSSYKNNYAEQISLEQSQIVDTASLKISDLLGKPHQIHIPTLKIISRVQDLKIIDDGGTKRYETPKQIVGRIPTNLKSADTVSGWYFGHLESPIKGEGNVFRDLPRIAEFLRDGDPVYIHVTNEYREYIYQATESKIVHESKLKLYDAGIENIVLVTCANRPHYDFRQLVTARLVGIK